MGLAPQRLLLEGTPMRKWQEWVLLSFFLPKLKELIWMSEHYISNYSFCWLRDYWGCHVCGVAENKPLRNCLIASLAIPSGSQCQLMQNKSRPSQGLGSFPQCWSRSGRTIIQHNNHIQQGSRGRGLLTRSVTSRRWESEFTSFHCKNWI